MKIKCQYSHSSDPYVFTSVFFALSGVDATIRDTWKIIGDVDFPVSAKKDKKQREKTKNERGRQGRGSGQGGVLLWFTLVKEDAPKEAPLISGNLQPSYVEAREAGMGKTNKTHWRSFLGRPTWNDNEVL